MQEDKPLHLGNLLRLNRCPHCHIAIPTLNRVHKAQTVVEGSPALAYQWDTYVCSSCGGAIIAKADRKPNSSATSHVTEIHPRAHRAQEAIPSRAREYLNQGIESKHAPAGAIMLCASSVDAMLKEQGLSEGSLYKRIEEAAKLHLITNDIAAWAHDVRLDANDQRHSDSSQPLPLVEDATRAIDFTLALAEILFVLPERVRRGRKAVESSNGRNT